MSLYQNVRPADWAEVRGNAGAVAILRNAAESPDRPHAFLLHGPSGCGKTTLARILASKLGCDVIPAGSCDYLEINASSDRGIDIARRITQESGFPPITGGVRVVVLDEFHAMTKDAMNALLKPLEDYPDHQYYILCTTEPSKLLKTIRTRCTHVEVKALSEDDLFALLGDIVDRHGVADPGEDVLDAIARRADGCPRSAVTMLEQQDGLPKEEALAAVRNYQTREQDVIGLCRLVVDGKPWVNIASAYVALEEREPETLRRIMLGYLRSCLLKAKKPGDAGKFAAMIEELVEPTYNSMEAGLVAMLWNAARVAKSE